MASTGDHREKMDEDSSDDQTFVLHRLKTGPRTASEQYDARHTGGTSSYVEEQKYGQRNHDVMGAGGGESEDEEAFLGMPRSPAPAPPLDKTGRPEWLQDGIHVAHSSRRVRLLLFLGVLFLLVCIFGFVFAGTGRDESDGRLERIYKWAGNVWHTSGDGSGAPGGGALASEKALHVFPIDVGFPGPTQEGKPPNLANEDKYTGEPVRGSSPIETNVPELGQYNPFELMGPLTPYRSAPDFAISTAKHRALPAGCHIDRVHILHRHGSRYPTTGSPANDIRKIVKDVQKLSNDKHFKGPLTFLNSYDPNRLGLELLVPVGRQQLFASGVQHGMEYGVLAAKDMEEHGRIFVRSGSQQRIVDSTIAFLQGMFGDKWHNKSDVEVQIEAPGFNTTLAPNFACPNAGKPGMEPGLQWAGDWADDYLRGAVQRLQSHTPGVTLTGKLLNGMQQLCSYDTVAFGRSNFCGLFTEQEWRDYEYYWDLEFYGSYGDGSPIGKAQGLGWVNEFMSRLTRTPWKASQQTTENGTLNSNLYTFPVDRHFYADFTHDSVVAGVVAALNLPDFASSLPVHTPNTSRKYHSSHIVPYAARLVFEEISCGSASGGDSNDERVRLLLNEAIVDLGQLQACTPRKDGMCARSEFIKAMEGRFAWSDWRNCTQPLRQ